MTTPYTPQAQIAIQKLKSLVTDPKLGAYAIIDSAHVPEFRLQLEAGTWLPLLDTESLEDANQKKTTPPPLLPPRTQRVFHIRNIHMGKKLLSLAMPRIMARY